MKEFRVGIQVYDRYWPWEIGTVTAVLKTRIKIRFFDGTRTYDKQHYRFLERA